MTHVKSTALADEVVVVLKAGDERLRLTPGSLFVFLSYATEIAGIPPIHIEVGKTKISGADSARIGTALLQIIATMADDPSPFFDDMIASNPNDALVALAVFARNAADTGFVIDHERNASELSKLPIDRAIVITIEDN